MASVKILYHCGCGYNTDKLEEAEEHSNSQNHTLTVLGTVEKEDK